MFLTKSTVKIDHIILKLMISFRFYSKGILNARFDTIIFHVLQCAKKYDIAVRNSNSRIIHLFVLVDNSCPCFYLVTFEYCFKRKQLERHRSLLKLLN